MISIIAINITKNVEKPYKVQEILSMYGNIIRTRLGLSCLEDDETGLRGIIVLEVLCDENNAQLKSLQEQLQEIEGLKLGTVQFE